MSLVIKTCPAFENVDYDKNGEDGIRTRGPAFDRSRL